MQLPLLLVYYMLYVFLYIFKDMLVLCANVKLFTHTVKNYIALKCLFEFSLTLPNHKVVKNDKLNLYQVEINCIFNFIMYGPSQFASLHLCKM